MYRGGGCAAAQLALDCGCGPPSQRAGLQRCSRAFVTLGAVQRRTATVSIVGSMALSKEAASVASHKRLHALRRVERRTLTCRNSAQPRARAVGITHRENFGTEFKETDHDSLDD